MLSVWHYLVAAVIGLVAVNVLVVVTLALAARERMAGDPSRTGLGT